MQLREGKCPKCGSDEIYAGLNIAPKSGPFASNSIPIGLFSIAALDNYVCAQCGYLESLKRFPTNGVGSNHLFHPKPQKRKKSRTGKGKCHESFKGRNQNDAI